MIGSEKLLPIIAVPAEHQGQPIQPNDVKIIGLNVKQGWTAETVNAAIKDDVATIGKNPKYIITDNDSKMRKAVKLSGHVWHRDISHTLAMFRERTYKNDADFMDFNERMTKCKKQFCMKEIAYLQSPSQRVKARFMNLSDWVYWADSMLQVFYLKEEENQLDGNEVVNNSSDIIESMFGMFKYIQSPNKLNGVTTLVLHLPVMLALKERPDLKNYNVNVRLIRTRMKDITLWRDKNLSRNLVTKRINTLRA